MIDYKNAAQMRELMERVTPGPWVAVQGQCWRVEPNIFNGCNEPWEGWYEEPCAEDAQFIAISREALPYWIERAEAAERAVGELITQVVKLYHCPPISKRIYCQSSTKETRVEECTVCWREWAMKEGK